MSTPRSIRLTFKREGERLELLRSKRLIMRPLPHTAVAADFKQGLGCWVELRDSAGETLFQRNAPSLGRTFLVAHTGDKEQPHEISRTAQDPIVSVLVPDMGRAASFHVFDRAASGKAAAGKATAGKDGKKKSSAKSRKKAAPAAKQNELFVIELSKLDGGA